MVEVLTVERMYGLSQIVISARFRYVFAMIFQRMDPRLGRLIMLTTCKLIRPPHCCPVMFKICVDYLRRSAQRHLRKARNEHDIQLAVTLVHWRDRNQRQRNRAMIVRCPSQHTKLYTNASSCESLHILLHTSIRSKLISLLISRFISSHHSPYPHLDSSLLAKMQPKLVLLAALLSTVACALPVESSSMLTTLHVDPN